MTFEESVFVVWPGIDRWKEQELLCDEESAREKLL